MKKKAKRKSTVPKTRAGGRWTEARYKQFVIGALRSAARKWAPKWDAIADAFVKDGPNPKTGRKCKLHRCESCQNLFAKGDMRADHIVPVVDPAKGFESYDKFIARLYVEKEGYQVVCVDCHQGKSNVEGAIRRGTLKPEKAVRRRTRKKSLPKKPC